VYEQVLEDLNKQRRREAAAQLYLALVDTYEVVLDDDEDGYIEGLDHLRGIRKDRVSDEAGREQLEELHMKVNAILPLRYQGRTDEDSNVAWDRIWGKDDPNQPFCELALAGGLANRGTLLEPVSPQEALSDLDAYGYQQQQLSTGIFTVSG
jgi:sirohydrochlorin cobaltochelatase